MSSPIHPSSPAPLTRRGAVEITVTGRAVRADSGEPLRDLIHVHVRQGRFRHWWEPRSDDDGWFSFACRLLRPGAASFMVARPSFVAVRREATVTEGRPVRLGTSRLPLRAAEPGTIGVRVGADIGWQNDPVEIIDVLLEGPADKAGLRCGDEILAVDGRRIRPAGASASLSGPAGTVVELEVRRLHWGKTPVRRVWTVKRRRMFVVRVRRA